MVTFRMINSSINYQLAAPGQQQLTAGDISRQLEVKKLLSSPFLLQIGLLQMAESRWKI